MPGESLPYRSAGRALRESFGGEVFRVVVDAGFSCPVRDGTLSSAGCLFCSVEGFRPPTSRPELPLREQVARALPHLLRRHPRAVGYLVYFQPYTNTHGTPERIERACREALALEGALGLVLGTRPDALAGPILDLLARLAREAYLQVEVGIQSTDDAALAAMERRHDWAAGRAALERLAARGLRASAHVILATPWESEASQIEGARRLSATGIAAVKIHHLQVLRGSRLAEREPAGGWRLPAWREYARLAADFLERLAPEVTVERLCASAPRRLLLAPRWEIDAREMRREVVRLMTERGVRQGSSAREGMR